MESVNSSSSQFEKIIKTMSTAELIEFREFLHDHLNHENFTFWLEVESYKQITDPKERKETAMRISTKFFTPGPYELNVPYLLKAKIKTRLLNPDINCFAEAQKAVVKVLYEDIYPKFINSPRFKQLKDEPKGKKKPRHTESYSTFAHFLETRNIVEPKPVDKKGSFLGNLMRKYSTDETLTRKKRSSSGPDVNDLIMAKSL